MEPILEALREGWSTVFLTGRSLGDLHLNEQGEIRPLLHTLARRAWQEHGMAMLRCNLALGPVPEFWPLLEADRAAVEQSIREAQACALLPTGTAAENRYPFDRAMEALRSIHSATVEGRKLPKLLVVFEFVEDLMPHGGNLHASPQFTELVCLLAQEFRLRTQEIMILFCGNETNTDPRVQHALHRVCLSQPGVEEKERFTAALLASELRAGSSLGNGLDPRAVANLSSGTPNAGLEHLVRASSRTGKPVTLEALIARKRDDVVRLSEGTLTSLDTRRVQAVQLAGRTVAKAVEYLHRAAQLVKEGSSTPANVLLAGAPSTGKTDMALLAAAMGQIPAYQIVSPKGGIVGETEWKVRLQMRILGEMFPCMGFVDEITLAMPTQSGQRDLDSGASNAVRAEWQAQLADRTREGRVLLVGTTNRPYDMGDALASRFTVIPVLSPVAADYPAILRSLLRQLIPDFATDETELHEAAAHFARKGIVPRRIHASLRNTMAMRGGRIEAGTALAAARDVIEASPSERAAAELADLSAILQTTLASSLPWTLQKNKTTERDPAFPMPDYLAAVVEDDGTPNRESLQRRITLLRNETGE